jgi:V8-like Glu-specific endopeptidase
MPLEDARNGSYGGDFEKVFGKASFMSYTKYLQGAERAKAVARIEDRQGDPQGTGFLTRGSDLSPHFAMHSQVLLTNAHVISASDPEAALHSSDARCAFYEMDSSKEGGVTKAAVKDILWSSPSRELDTTIVSLDREITGLEPCTIARAMPKPGPDSKAFIIGYPSGGGLSFSLFGNEILAYEEKSSNIHYRTPTEPGSSGSPVFNQNWELIAIHHSGSSNMNRLDGAGTYEANEGIKFLSLIEAINT